MRKIKSRRRNRSNSIDPAEYTVTPSGFRYRLLNINPKDGFAVASSALLPGESLYRMMDGVHRVRGNLFPVLIRDKSNFKQSVTCMRNGKWSFKLAAGIPVESSEQAA